MTYKFVFFVKFKQVTFGDYRMFSRLKIKFYKIDKFDKIMKE